MGLCGIFVFAVSYIWEFKEFSCMARQVFGESMAILDADRPTVLKTELFRPVQGSCVGLALEIGDVHYTGALLVDGNFSGRT